VDQTTRSGAASACRARSAPASPRAVTWMRPPRVSRRSCSAQPRRSCWVSTGSGPASGSAAHA